MKRAIVLTDYELPSLKTILQYVIKEEYLVFYCNLSDEIIKLVKEEINKDGELLILMTKLTPTQKEHVYYKSLYLLNSMEGLENEKV